EDFDNRVVDYFVQEFERRHKKDIRDNPRAVRRLRTACERAKRNLSFMLQTTIGMDCLYEGIDFEYRLTREKFEELNMDLFERCIGHVNKCLKDAKMDKKSIHDVVLVGGSTRIPRVQQLLQDYFNGKQLCKSIHPDEAVACGAAAQAAILTGKDNHEIRDLTWWDVTPLSLGVCVNEDEMSVVVPKNTTIPAKKEKEFMTRRDDQTSIRFALYEGERPRASDNIELAEFVLSDIPPARRGVHKFDVCFEIDANGILTVSAKDKTSGKMNSITISNVRGMLAGKDEIERMLEEAERFELEDEEHKKKFKARKLLVDYVYDTRDEMAKELALKLPTTMAKKLEDEIKHAIEWLEEHQVGTLDVFENKRKELTSIWDPIMTNL
ncbi:heat shock cognate 70 kDa protein 2-like, partial [Dorcoceras hygrometricum]